MLTLFLRLVHVVGGAIWVGAVFVSTFYVFPSIRAVGPAGGAVMRQIGGVRKLPVFLTVTGWLVVLAGLTLYLRNAMGGSNGWAGSRAGIAFGTGGVIAIVALLFGTFYVRPLAERMSAIGAQLQGAGTPPPADLMAEMTRTQETFHKRSTVVAWMIIITTVAMSVARYL